MSDPKQYQKISVFVASPSDMATEKGLLGRVVDSLNKGLADYLGLILEVKEWSSVLPSMGRPEGVILDQLPIQEWDIFVGLMWLRFGQPTGGKDISGNEYESGTEEEFSLAYQSWLKANRPRIMFYRCVRAPKTITQVDSNQYSKVENFFNQFNAVKGKHPGLYKEFDSATDFERDINEHLAKLLLSFSEQTKKTSINDKMLSKLLASEKSNLPRKAPFFGRNVELDFALKALSPDERGWGLVIDGIGGIGKTAIAIEVAYQCQEKAFFDEYVFITAKQLVLEPSGIHKTLLKENSLDGFLNELARRIGRADLAQPIEMSKKQKEILDALRERRVLIIFDNLETLPKPEQHSLTEFLKYLPVGSKAIITTRQGVGESVAQLRLDKLSWEDSLKIIKNQIEIQGAGNFPKLDDMRWKELYDHTGGSPLALIWSIGLIRTLSFDVILQRFRDGIQGDLSEFLYSESFHQMDENEKHAMSALAFFETPTTKDGLSRTSGLPLRSIDTVLERLRVFGLVNMVKNETLDDYFEKYSLHPLTKKYAMADLLKNKQLYSKLGINFSEYWIDFIKLSAKPNIQETFDIIEIEWRNFESAAEWLWKTSEVKEQTVKDQTSARLLINLCDGLQAFFLLNDRIDDLAKFNSWAFECSYAMRNSTSAEKFATNAISGYENLHMPNHAIIWKEKLRTISKVSRSLRIFILHASQDKPAVRELYRKLSADGFDAWLDEEKLLPGQDFDMEIYKAVRDADIIIICLSNASIRKEGYIQKEIKRALDIVAEKPEGVIYMIPARLEECEVPSRLKSFHWVDLFEVDGYSKLRKSLSVRAESLRSS